MLSFLCHLSVRPDSVFAAKNVNKNCVVKRPFILEFVCINNSAFV